MPLDSTDPGTTSLSTPFRLNGDGVVRIWAYIGADDRTRGDTHGRTGIAAEMARILDGRALCVDHDMLAGNFPNLPDVKARLTALMEREGRPDIVLGKNFIDDAGLASDATLQPTLYCRDYNENLAKLFGADLSNTFNAEQSALAEILVPHSLTPEILKEQGALFRHNYPEIKGPLIAVMWADVSSAGVDRLVDLCAHYPNGTLFICPTWRTDESQRLAGVNFLRSVLANRDYGTEIIDMPFEDIKNGGFNPYKGLLAEADHVIVGGHSRSIVSEALMRDRPVFTLESYGSETGGRIVRLDKIPPDQPLPTQTVTPINATRAIAEAGARQFIETGERRAFWQPQVSPT